MSVPKVSSECQASPFLADIVNMLWTMKPLHPGNLGMIPCTNKQWFPLVSKWCRFFPIHSDSGLPDAFPTLTRLVTYEIAALGIGPSWTGGEGGEEQGAQISPK